MTSSSIAPTIMPSNTSVTTSRTTPLAPSCRTDQLAITLSGINALTGGQWAAAYWVRNPSPGTCSLDGPTTVKLLGPTGAALMSVSSQATITTLPAETPPPSSAGEPASGTAYFDVLFRSEDIATGGGLCPTAPKTPSALLVTFGNVSPVEIHDVSGSGQQIAVCGTDLDVLGIKTIPMAGG